MKRVRKETIASWKRRRAKRSAAMRKHPGRSWRILAWGKDPVHASSTPELRASLSKTCKSLRENWLIFDGPPWRNTVFDELVIDDWLHLEQMDTDLWWLNLGDRDLIVWIEVPKKGPIRIGVSDESKIVVTTKSSGLSKIVARQFARGVVKTT
jgi:hypothetical protein